MAAFLACFGLPSRSHVPDRYLKPAGQRCSELVDLRKLRGLILDGKLVPCFPGADGPASAGSEEPRAVTARLLRRKGQNVQSGDLSQLEGGCQLGLLEGQRASPLGGADSALASARGPLLWRVGRASWGPKTWPAGWARPRDPVP
jgi:hypothetical protein